MVIAFAAHHGDSIGLGQFEQLVNAGLICGSLGHALIVGTVLTWIAEGRVGRTAAEDIAQKVIADARLLQIVRQYFAVEL